MPDLPFEPLHSEAQETLIFHVFFLCTELRSKAKGACPYTCTVPLMDWSPVSYHSIATSLFKFQIQILLPPACAAQRCAMGGPLFKHF
mmetsp:Transcript_18058/g.39589  ORF Transcript_18058/g.39589 Transcript_18058/m.39589 type:complete len:88 (+) Transcript_18058:32-295(+)